MRLLAVDDDPVVLDLLKLIFKSADLPEVSVTSSAVLALEMLSNPDFEFDGLILDISMPEMSGIELCRLVRRMPRYQHKPILMLTSVMDTASVESAFAAGADDYITKPFDVKDIVARVRVAERMTQKSQPVAMIDRDLCKETDKPGLHQFSIEDPLRIHGAPQLIQPFALGNYLCQLSRRRLDNCVLFAVQLCDIDTLYQTCKTHELARGLHGVVTAVSEVVKCPTMLTAYEGSGILMCITLGSEPPAWPEMEYRVRDAIAAQNLCRDDGTKMCLEVAVGNPITPSASRYQRVNKTFERTRSRVHTRMQSTHAQSEAEADDDDGQISSA
ncbi:Two component transcriptional regulator, winged helix family protein [Sulfitobacter noctilucicola]|uniref:DNA-binding response OmpR family regulator n=1 Tax=Sulfitobacter noctilucicola TaxID=1342301 RepID=A0A7W6Q560_9RHOB|nr:response regulator [Sulfitobacter noctilucicola]KIN64047.1 Two component transcriptional regulator, winged helix family protein [Sulfitobacter noctilucicola]MBB4175403.1 DNA-binding response OmpR family regulator [Sulfitobacter noctilucicola]